LANESKLEALGRALGHNLSQVLQAVLSHEFYLDEDPFNGSDAQDTESNQ
jgi:hypothetical protein